MDVEGREMSNIAEAVEELSSNMKGKMVVSIDEGRWEKLGRRLAWTVLVKLASGRSIPKDAMEETLLKIWRV